MDKSELTLCYRLATRYVPNQKDSSTLSWGPLFGIEEVRRLARCFADRSILHDVPTITCEWAVYYVLDIIQDRLLYADRQHPQGGTETQSLDSAQVMRYYEDIFQWARSFAVQIRNHDPLCELCEASNRDLHALIVSKDNHRVKPSRRSLHSQETSYSQDTLTSQETPQSQTDSLYLSASTAQVRRSWFNRARSQLCEILPDYNVRSFKLSATSQSSDARPARRGSRTYAVVRWSDLTTNFLRDYERNHIEGEKDLSFRRMSGAQSPRGSDAAAKARESGGAAHSPPLFGGNQHVYAADCVAVAPHSGLVATASRDGIVKLWHGSTGAFRSNLYNAGTAWVAGMFFMHDEDYILIATTNAQLTVLEFPDGVLVQKYAGCYSATTASRHVTQLSARNTQRYGMHPGACGPHRVPLRGGEAPEAYHRRRHLAYEDAATRAIAARPIVGFLSPTACWFETQSGVFFFGTADGGVGAVDLSADVRLTALLAGTSTRPIRLNFALDVHHGAVVGVFYTSYISSLITAGADGVIQRIPLTANGGLAGETRRVATAAKPIRLMHWAPPSKYFITAHVDRRVQLWSIGRHGEPLHRFPEEAQEVIGAALHPHHGRLAVLLSDKTIQVYDTHGTRPVATIAQPPPESNFTAREAWRIMMERSQNDESGAIAWHPHHARIYCGLRNPVLYETVSAELGAAETRVRGRRSDASTGQNNHRALHDTHNHSNRRGAAHMGEGDAKEHADAESDDDSDADNHAFCSSSFCFNTQATHRGGVVAVALQRSARELHTFDAATWRTWSVDTGERLRHVNISRAVRCERLPVKSRAAIVSAVWTSHAAARLLTGGEGGALITWDPATGAPVAAESMSVELGELDSDVGVLHTHRNRVVACASRTCRVATVNTAAVLPNGAEESRAVVMRVPSLASITACCILRESHLCLGTAEARLYFFALRGGPPIRECALREGAGERRDRGGNAVVQLVFLNEQNQSLILAILDGGLMFVYSYVGRCILRRMRIARRFESRISRVMHMSDDASLVCGDSLGRVHVYDVSGCTSADAVGFRQSFVVKMAFQGATDEITGFDAFTSVGRRHLIVASLDRYVRLFQLNDAPGDAVPTSTLSSNVSTRPRSVKNTGVFVFVGTFGRDLWNLSDPGTFSDCPPLATENNAAREEEAALLDAILNDGARSSSSMRTTGHPESPTPEITYDAPLEKPQQSFYSATPTQPPPPPLSPRVALFLTDGHRTSRSPPSPDDLASSASGKEGGSASTHTNHHNMEHLRSSCTPVSLPTHQRASFSGLQPSTRRKSVSLVDSESIVDPPHSRYPPLSLRLHERRTSTIADSVDAREPPEDPQQQQQQQQQEENFPSPQRQLSDSAQRGDRSMLEIVSHHLAPVQPRGLPPGFFPAAKDKDAAAAGEVRHSRHSRGRMDSDDYRTALEKRRLLAERMEEYRKRQETQRREKRDAALLVSTRQAITAFVLPRPNVEQRGMKDWLQSVSLEVPSVPSVVSRHAPR